jgi:hypothetical protein
MLKIAQTEPVARLFQGIDDFAVGTFEAPRPVFTSIARNAMSAGCKAGSFKRVELLQSIC